MREHRIRFAGTIAFADGVEDVIVPGSVGLVSAGPAEELDAGAHVAASRPDRATVDELAAAVRAARPRVVYGAGSGAVLDAAKLAAHHAGHEGEIVLVPAGDEPWRAFAPFSVVDHGPGERPTHGDATGGVARVVVIGDLLAALDERTVAVNALDTAVHAIEVQLSVRRQPYAQALAAAALRLVGERFDAAREGAGDARVELVLAAGLAVEGFMGTNLGIAHALASPLGARLGITHDAINAVLGRWAVTFQADPVRVAGVAAALGAPEAVAALDGLRERAGLPRTLRGLGIPWDAVEATLPAAVQSSGIRGAVSIDELRAFARTAWDDNGHHEEVEWRPSS